MKRTVFVIEKDEGILEVVSLVLSDRGFEVKTLQTETGAVEAIIEVMPCAIILDIMAITAAGTELCRLIRKHPEIKHIPIIVFSTHPNASEFKEICADDVIAKPFDIDELIAAVEKQLINS